MEFTAEQFIEWKKQRQANCKHNSKDTENAQISRRFQCQECGKVHWLKIGQVYNGTFEWGTIYIKIVEINRFSVVFENNKGETIRTNRTDLENMISNGKLVEHGQ